MRQAEELALSFDTVFARYLVEQRHRLLLRPVPSGWCLPTLLWVLSEDADEHMAAEIYLNLRNGYDLIPVSVDDDHVPSHKFRNYPDAMKNPRVIDDELQRLLSNGYIDDWRHIAAEAGRPELREPFYVMPINLLSKTNPDGTPKHRMIFDPSRPDGDSFNDHCSDDIFTRYINIWMALTAMSSGGAAWRADFQDAYFQLPLSLRSRYLVGFQWKGKMYGFRRGAFGFRPLPWLQQSITIALVRATHRRMIRAGLRAGSPPEYSHHYYVRQPNSNGHEHTALLPLLDDVGGFATSVVAGLYGFLSYIWTCHLVGCKCSPKPGKTVPPSTQDMVFIGYLLSLENMTVSMEPQRIRIMENRLVSILETGWVTRTDMESVVGTLVFITTVVGMRTYYRSFIELMRAQRRRSRLVLTDAVRSDMLKWQKLLHLFNGQSVYRGVRRASSRFPLYTDASFSGWGFAWCDLVVPGKWPEPWLSRFGHLPKHLKHSGSHPDRIWIHFC